MDFSRFNTVSRTKSSVSYDAGLRNYMIQVYNYMFLGLAITALVSLFVANTQPLLYAIHGTPLR